MKNKLPCNLNLGNVGHPRYFKPAVNNSLILFNFPQLIQVSTPWEFSRDWRRLKRTTNGDLDTFKLHFSKRVVSALETLSWNVFFGKRQQTTTTSIGFWLLVSIDSDFVGVTVLGKELKDYTYLFFNYRIEASNRTRSNFTCCLCTFYKLAGKNQRLFNHANKQILSADLGDTTKT